MADIALGFVPIAGQAYGAASAAAALRDPEAGALEKGMGALSFVPGGRIADRIRKIVVGKNITKGNAALESALKRAQQMARERTPSTPDRPVTRGAAGMKELLAGDPRINDDLAKETGWFIDPDTGKWMTELDDSRALPDYEFMDQAIQNRTLSDTAPISLGDAMFHPELAKMPEGQQMLNQMGVKYNPKEVGRGGRYSPTMDEMEFGAPVQPNPKDMGQVRDTLLHETQHGIAEREGFLQGTDPDVVGWKEYMNNPGEMLARVVALRRNMTPDARRKYPIHRHMDDERYRLMQPGEANRYATDADLKRALMLRNLDPDEMLVPGP